MRTLILALAFVATGCCNPSKASDASPATTATGGQESKTPSSTAAAGDLVDVDLKPIPLTIRVPKGGMGAMDMSIGDKKSMTVDIGDGASLNVQEMAEKDFAQLKAGFKGDKILFPFKKFAKEEASSFVVEFEGEGKKVGYIGVTMKEIAGKKYVCKTTGLDGVKTAELAEKELKVCDTLKAK
ncbi:MAG: hypothetical protein HY898_15840 [Deltaproteobacteria bacterium]|nr:hypothetical protein [Deltaproteobacteria bacterium]